MISAYSHRAGTLVRLDAGAELSSHDLLWIDLFDPTGEEEKAVEAMLGLQVPTRQEMAEIEESSRLYEEAGARVMTAVVVDGVARGRPSRAQVTFVLTPDHLVTVRYADPLPFKNFDVKIQRSGPSFDTPERIFIGLLDSIVERLADILELTAAEFNEVSVRLFLDDENRKKPSRAEDEMQVLVKRLGRKNMTLGFLRESLLTLSRVVPYARQEMGPRADGGNAVKLKQLERDIRSLAVYEAELSSELRYLHEATLGLINLAQNRIIKVFSIAAVLFLPPTVVGTVYGMNFKHMPELEWTYGYPMALALMTVSAILPVMWLRRRGWF